MCQKCSKFGSGNLSEITHLEATWKAEFSKLVIASRVVLRVIYPALGFNRCFSLSRSRGNMPKFVDLYPQNLRLWQANKSGRFCFWLRWYRCVHLWWLTVWGDIAAADAWLQVPRSATSSALLQVLLPKGCSPPFPILVSINFNSRSPQTGDSFICARTME